MSDHLFWLTDEQFARLEALLPTDRRGKARVDDRCVIRGIIHVLKLDGRWGRLPRPIGRARGSTTASSDRQNNAAVSSP